MDLHSFVDSEKLQAAAHRRVLNLTVTGYVLDFRIGDAAVVFEERR
jgi:hypothetical protein